ncbi:MAG: alpha/beta hydrolase [Oscillospiraceae bacterium]|nr:alpha/beta hydrolase [Oscillospiraceae bacterium]
MDQFVKVPGDTPMHTVLDVSRVERKYLDLAYGEHPRQKLDIYLPETGEGPFPVIVYIHGGAFVGGDKRDDQMLHAADGIARGYAVVSYEQRLLPEGVFPLPVYDTKAALRWLKAHAKEYCLDPERFAIAGDSAGAYHALFAAATQEIPAFDGPEAPRGGDSRVKAAIGLFGVYDLAMQAQFSFDQGPFPGAKEVFNFADMFAGGDTRKCKALGYLTDCKTWVTPAMPKVLIQCGDHDQIVPYKASLELADRIRAVCGEDRAELDVFPGALHGDPAYLTKENIERLFRFLDGVLK